MTDERPPVIWEKGVKIFGDEDMMKMMVQNFEPQSFDCVMKDLSSEFVKENWPEVKRHAHTLKGSSRCFLFRSNCESLIVISEPIDSLKSVSCSKTLPTQPMCPKSSAPTKKFSRRGKY